MLVRTVEAAARALGLADGCALVAVSGGVDSTVLLDVLVRLAPRLDLELQVAHVHHGLRGEAADQDACFVEELAAKRALPAAVLRVDPHALRDGHPSRSRPTLQEAARQARYRALLREAERVGARWIATAHTLDDQAETVLLRLLRGAGPGTLGGIPERGREGRLVRPLLGVSREVLEAWALGEGLRWREDASNESRAYARNRVRHDLLPRLREDWNPNLLRALGHLAEAERRDAEWLEPIVEREAAQHFRRHGPLWVVDAEALRTVPEGLARRLARWLLRRAGAGRDVSRTHVLRLLAFLREARSGAAIELPGDLVCRREGHELRLGPRGVNPPGTC